MYLQASSTHRTLSPRGTAPSSPALGLAEPASPGTGPQETSPGHQHMHIHFPHPQRSPSACPAPLLTHQASCPPHGVPAHPLLPFGAGCAHQCPHTHPTSTRTHNTLSNSTVPCAGPAQSLLVNVGPPQMPRAESGAASSPSSFTLSFPTEQVPIR